jgi:hypothetical protein
LRRYTWLRVFRDFLDHFVCSPVAAHRTGILAVARSNRKVNMSLNVKTLSKQFITKLLTHPNFVPNSSFFYNPVVINVVFGKEAAMQCFYLILKKAIDTVASISPKHLWHITSHSAAYDTIEQIKRTNVERHGTVLDRMAFERTANVSAESAFNHETSWEFGFYGSLLVGNPYKIGTNFSTIQNLHFPSSPRK